MVLVWVRGAYIFIYKWGCKQVNWNTNSFLPEHLNLKRKENIFLYHLAHVQKSFIVHQVIYSFFPLVWQHSLFQLSNSLIQTITAFVVVIMITDAFIHNTDTLQWIGYSYALMSALFPHANTPRPDVTECKRSLR